MSDLRTLVRDEMERAGSPSYSFDDLGRRRDRKRRNQRIAAGVVGIAVFVAAVWVVTTGGSFDRTTPADKPTVNTAAEEVALGFLDAYAAFDAQKAMSYVAEDAHLRGLINPQVPADTEGLSLMLSMLEASGSKLILTSCETAAFGSDTSVVCDFDFHLIRSDEIGRGPFSGLYFVFTVRDGAIVRAGVSENTEKFWRQMWEPFAEWVSSTYPKDAAVMYLDGTLAGARLSPESIRLWERHTREYVETRSTETGPAESTAPVPALASAAPDVVRQGRCSDGAKSQLALTDLERRILVRFELHRSPVGHTWRITIIHGGGIMGPDIVQAFRGFRVAGDSGDFSVQLPTPDRFHSASCGGSGCPADWFRARAWDTQTGQFCRVYAAI